MDTSYWWAFCLVGVCSYLIGSINSSITISSFMGKDIREIGSGNPGTLNMSRNFGIKIGVLILLLDILKGVVPTLTAKLIFGDMVFSGTSFPIYYLSESVAGFCVILGHIFPLFYGFKGGKGIASSIGVFFVLKWWVALIFGVLAIAFILITKIGSLGSFIATIPPAIWCIVERFIHYFTIESNKEDSLVGFIISVSLILLITVMTIVAHRQNIKRLIKGEEHQTDWWGQIKKLKDKGETAE